LTPPKRLVQGDKTSLQFNNACTSIRATATSTRRIGHRRQDGRLPRDADGNVAPKRILATPHRVYNIAVDEEEASCSSRSNIHRDRVYPKAANGKQEPLRRIRGDATGLDAPHGIAVDEKISFSTSTPGAITATSGFPHRPLLSARDQGVSAERHRRHAAAPRDHR